MTLTHDIPRHILNDIDNRIREAIERQRDVPVDERKLRNHLIETHIKYGVVFDFSLTKPTLEKTEIPMKRLTSIQLHNFAERLEREATKDWGGIPALWYGLIGREHYKQAVAEELRKLALERLKEERGYK